MNAWQMVTCGDCGRTYQCTPLDDFYLPDGATDDVRVCFVCLLARNGLRLRDEGP